MLKINRRLPPLNSLRAFETAARHGSITRAAEELGVTQSAVSHQIRALECFTGVALLDRRGNSFTLTSAGLRAMDSLGTGFELIADAVANLDTSDISGEVIVSCPPALTALWLVKNIRGFLLNYPGIRLNLRSSTQWGAVIGADVDLCIRYGNGVWDNRRTILLGEVDLFPVCSPLIAPTLQKPTDLENTALLYANDNDEWSAWLTLMKLNNMPHTRHYLGNDLAMIEAAVNSIGVAIGDSVTCRNYLETGVLVAPFAETKRSSSGFYLIEKVNVKRKVAVNCVRDWIVELFTNGTPSTH